LLKIASDLGVVGAIGECLEVMDKGCYIFKLKEVLVNDERETRTNIP